MRTAAYRLPPTAPPPLPQTQLQAGGALEAFMPLYAQQLDARPVHIAAAFGAYRAGQLRRDFHSYIEASRAVPWRQWLHYNSWYQLRRPESMKENPSFLLEDELNATNLIRVAAEYKEQLLGRARNLTFQGCVATRPPPPPCCELFSVSSPGCTAVCVGMW